MAVGVGVARDERACTELAREHGVDARDARGEREGSRPRAHGGRRTCTSSSAPASSEPRLLRGIPRVGGGDDELRRPGVVRRADVDRVVGVALRDGLEHLAHERVVVRRGAALVPGPQLLLSDVLKPPETPHSWLPIAGKNAPRVGGAGLHVHADLLRTRCALLALENW